MIIELFGAPGSGKTTFARALTARLRERGHIAELKLSCRPSEHHSARPMGPNSAVIRRLRRPIAEILSMARHPFANACDLQTALNMIKILPPRSIIASIKQSQYISRLSHSWHETSGSPHITLFDQAFMQVVCSLALLAGIADEALISSAIDCVPPSDLYIRVDAPLEIVRLRLRDRWRMQSTIEQLFELDLKMSLASISLVERLHGLLLKRGRSVACGSSVDQRSLDESVHAIEEQITAKLRPELKGVA
jgi:hypothetical protein